MHVVKSWRDLGREGHGRAFANGSPYVRNGIFVVSSTKQGQVTREAGPGMPPERRNRLENPGLKQPHKFVEVNGLCLTCNMMAEGHERLMEKLNEATSNDRRVVPDGRLRITSAKGKRRKDR